LFSGSYTDLTSKPTLFDGAYSSLSGKPTLFSGSYTDLTSKPTLFSGSYTDLTSKPTLFDGAYSSLSGKPSLATVATSGSYTDLTDKPTLFSGSYTDLTDKPTIPTDINQLSDTNGLLGSSSSTVNIQSYNYDATAGQLIFTGQGENQQALSYTDYDFVQVFKNGILLRNNIQYTLNDSGYVDYAAMGDSIELTTPAELNDWIYIIVTSTTTSNPDFTTDGGAYADVMEPGLDGGPY